jgi:hypothetical protein
MFYKVLSGNDTWYMNAKSMESAWELPAGAKVVEGWQRIEENNDVCINTKKLVRQCWIPRLYHSFMQ